MRKQLMKSGRAFVLIAMVMNAEWAKAEGDSESFNQFGSRFGGPSGLPPQGPQDVGTFQAAFEVRTNSNEGGKQVKQDCAVCHRLSVLINGKEYGDGAAVTLPKGETHTVKVKDTPVPRDTPPGGDSSAPHTSNQKFTVWPQAVDGQTITSIQGNGPADSPQVFIAKKAEILQYLLDNSEGLMAQDKDWPENPADEPMNKTARLASVELKDLKGAGDADDVTITPWDTAQSITNQNIAWIDAHTSDQNPAPRMPQLEFRMPSLPQGFTIEAKLEVKYDRGNGARTGRNQAEDTVKIPSNGNFKQVSGSTWQIWSEYQSEDFFGGDAKLTYRLKSGSTEILPATTINFRIGGKNPDDARCRAYIETFPDSGPNGGLWFAYAVARSESKDYNGQGSRYNQFLELPAHIRDVGRPLWSPDDETTPGGYGMFQVTGNASDSTANIPRKQIWNWQDNVAACLAILASKRTTAVAWITQQKNANNAKGTALPDHTVGIVTFSEGTARTMTHAVTIKLYNGASRAPAGFVDSGTATGFRLDPQGAGHYCFWRNASNEWALNRFNDPPDPTQPFNYVARVCGEVGN